MAGTPCCKEFHIGVVYGKLYGWGGRVSVRFIYFEVGLGSRFRFWHDCWCGEQLLKITFPILFEIATYWEAFVVDMLVNHMVRKGRVGIYSSNVVSFHALESQNPPNEDGDRMRLGLKSKGILTHNPFLVL